jgi:excisionase family DNA binding protein
MAKQRKPSADTVQNSVAQGVASFSPYLSKQQAADLLGCTTRYLERQASAGKLKILKPSGKLWRVRRTDLDAFMESGASIAA